MNDIRKLPELSRPEFEILRVLWKKGRLTVRELHDEISPAKGWAYTTTKTMMDRMAGKGMLKRVSFHGIFLYEPQISRPAGMARLIQFFADQVLEMDRSSVVAMFAQSDAITPEEISELQSLLDEKE